jgi:hypothetical protein
VLVNNIQYLGQELEITFRPASTNRNACVSTFKAFSDWPISLHVQALLDSVKFLLTF